MHPANDFETRFSEYNFAVHAKDGIADFPIAVYRAQPISHQGSMTIWRINETEDEDYEQDVGVPSNDDPSDYISLHIMGRHPGTEISETWKRNARV
ncbi:MAG: hypothetical protein KAV00_12370 [Phycisphaerae bacterium]|nr:hypothetical protein [Phycisphaerae bacterium]